MGYIVDFIDKLAGFFCSLSNEIDAAGCSGKELGLFVEMLLELRG